MLGGELTRAPIVHDMRHSAIQLAQIEGRCHRDGVAVRRSRRRRGGRHRYSSIIRAAQVTVDVSQQVEVDACQTKRLRYAAFFEEGRFFLAGLSTAAAAV